MSLFKQRIIYAWGMRLISHVNVQTLHNPLCAFQLTLQQHQIVGGAVGRMCARRVVGWRRIFRFRECDTANDVESAKHHTD